MFTETPHYKERHEVAQCSKDRENIPGESSRRAVAAVRWGESKKYLSENAITESRVHLSPEAAAAKVSGVSHDVTEAVSFLQSGEGCCED